MSSRGASLSFLLAFAPVVATCALVAAACGGTATDLASPSSSRGGGRGADGGSTDVGDRDGGLAADAAAQGDDGAPGGDSPPVFEDAGDAGPHEGRFVAYVGGYGAKITTYTVDPHVGTLAPAGSIDAFGASPSFLAVDRAATHLYAVDENANGRVGAYAIDPSKGTLTFLNAVSSKGNGPAHLSVDATGKWVLVANYGDGTVAVLPVHADGRLGDATQSLSVGANAHMIVTDPTNRFVFVPCKGADYVAQLRFDPATGALTPNATPRVSTAAGAGPRHLAFHPNGKLAYLVNELNSTIGAYALDPASGTLKEIQTLPTVPAGTSGNTGAEVWVHPSGALVFASNRGDDTIAVFAIDAATGKMTPKGRFKTGGATPRDFTLSPDGAFLYAADQGSNDLATFHVDAAQGTLSPTAPRTTVTQPTFIGVVRLPTP